MMIIPPPEQRPVCVLVSWLAEHPEAAALLEYRDGATWLPASTAPDDIDGCWPVEVRRVRCPWDGGCDQLPHPKGVLFRGRQLCAEHSDQALDLMAEAKP